MSILPDHYIQKFVETGLITIHPFVSENVQPASVDLTLDRRFRVFVGDTVPRGESHLWAPRACIDPEEDQSHLFEEVEVPEGGSFYLYPGDFVLGSSVERLGIPSYLVGRLDGKSSLARLGLIIENAGNFDPGFTGTATMEIANITRMPIRLRPGMKIGHISFARLSDSARRPYGHPDLGSKYQGQDGPTGSRYHLNGAPQLAKDA